MPHFHSLNSMPCKIHYPTSKLTISSPPYARILVLFLIILLSILFLMLVRPIGTLQFLSSNSERQKPSHERDPTEYTPCQRFTLRFYACCKTEETARQEWTDGSTCSG